MDAEPACTIFDHRRTIFSQTCQVFLLERKLFNQMDIDGQSWTNAH